MIETIILMCSLIAYSPGYDCDEIWTVYKHDTMFVPYKDYWISAWVNVTSKEVHVGTISVDRCGMPLLWHELLHLKYDDSSHDWYRNYGACKTVKGI